MTTTDPVLAEMVRKLAAMSPSDRDFVLGQLSDSEAGLLAPHLEPAEVRPVSQALRALAVDCAGDRVPDGLRPRAAAAIDIAVTAASLFDGPLIERPAALRSSLRVRAEQFLARR